MVTSVTEIRGDCACMTLIYGGKKKKPDRGPTAATDQGTAGKAKSTTDHGPTAATDHGTAGKAKSTDFRGSAEN